MSSHFTNNKQLYLLWGVAIGVRLIWWLAVVLWGDTSFTTHDSSQFELLAHNLITHGEFSRSVEAPFFPDFARTPGYPVFLAAFKYFHLSNMWIALFQLLLTSFVPLQLFLVAKKRGFQHPIVAFCIVGFDLSLLLFSPMILSDGFFFIALSTLLYFLLIKPVLNNRILLIALISGLLILIRPIAIIFPLLILMYLWRSKHAFKTLIVYVLVGLLAPLGWSIRNNYHFSTNNISSMSSNNLLLYNAAGVLAKAEGRSFSEVQSELAYEQLALQDWEDDPLASKKYVEQCNEKAISILSAHPLLFAKQAAHSISLYFFKPPRSYFDQVFDLNYSYAPIDGLGELSTLKSKFEKLFAGSSPLALILMSFSLLMNILVFVLAFWGARFLLKNNPQLAILLIGGALYFCFLSVFTATDARFRLPAIPFLALLASAVPIKTRTMSRLQRRRLS